MKREALTIKPLDIISVRDGRPFDVGGNHLARAIWPPSPWTVLGSIRTLLLNKLGVDLRAYGKGNPANSISDEVMKVVGPCDGPPGFCIGPVFITRENSVPFKNHVWIEGSVPIGGGPVFPAPMDLVLVSSSETTQELARCSLKSKNELAQKGYFSSSKTPFILLPPDERRVEEPPSKWGLTLEGMERYLSGETPVWPHAGKQVTGETERSVISDSRVGIALKDGVADEGMFYIRRGYTVAPGWSLTLPLFSKSGAAEKPSGKDPANISEEIRCLEGTLRLGGDGHLARVDPCEIHLPGGLRDNVKNIKNVENAENIENVGEGPSNCAVLYLPGFTCPDDLTEESLSRSADCKVKVLAAATARPQPIGGWSIAKKGPRTMKRYLPPGTVIYIEYEEYEPDSQAHYSRPSDFGPHDSRLNPLMKLHGRSIATDPEEAAAGFGWCLIGQIQ
jgi:CRISPR-associated protein Cmr3